MSWGPYPAESSGSTSAWPNQVAYSYNYGPSASILDHANNPIITNSQINTNCITQIQARTTGLDFLGKHSALGAIYNSLEREQLDAPKCHPNTRKAVIKKIVDWICGIGDSETLIMWLYGAAGAGKSAIAHTLAEICEACGWLVASFFFWKTAGERNNANRFVATIAHQTALTIPASREPIAAAVDYNPFIFEQSIDVQLSKLIIEPLEQLFSTGLIFDISPLVIIIDGLDECQGEDVQSGIVKSLVAAFHHSSLRIRILISSRPEVHLRPTFNSNSIQPHLSRLALSDEFSPEEDIYRFLEDSFDRIRREHPLASYIPSSWPSNKVIHELTRKSSGQFIFASTTVKYIGGDPHQRPDRRLDVIRRLQPPIGEKDMPYAELNSLYHYVLSNVDNIEAVKLVLGTLIVVNPDLGSSDEEMNYTHKMSKWLFWQAGETEACLSQLASVIECDADGDISVLHASLSDFLLDPFRSHQFYLCRESVLGDNAALGLRHMHQQEYDQDDFWDYLWVTQKCIKAGPRCTHQLQEELSQLSFQTLDSICEIFNLTDAFWSLSSEIIKMLDKQNLKEKFPHLISGLQAVCMQTRHDSDQDPILLIFEAQYSHILQIEPSNLASLFPLKLLPGADKNLRWIINRLFIQHSPLQGVKFMGQHYMMVAKHFMMMLHPHLCQSAEEYHMGKDWKKEAHSQNLSALLCIAHVLPLTCRSDGILEYIFLREGCPGHRRWRDNFHRIWTLDGWNDHIIQPARDAVLDYYKHHAEPSDVEEYMHLNNLP